MKKTVRIRAIHTAALAMTMSLLAVSAEAAGPAPAAPAKAAAPAAATPPKPRDKIMSADELRACVDMKQKADDAAKAIRERQRAFQADRDALKADQADLAKASERQKTRYAELMDERSALGAAESALNAKRQAVKTDEEKAALVQEADKFNERKRRFDEDAAKFNAERQEQQQRIASINARVDEINQRTKSVNDGVDAALQLQDDWLEKCGNRRYREEDEVEISKDKGKAKP